MQRCILRFAQDEQHDWLAILSCGHTQHVRHKPPFQNYPWIMTAEGRASKIGQVLDCPLCDRGESPDNTTFPTTR